MTLSKEFINVKGNQKLANDLHVATAPGLVFVDPDGDEIYRTPFTDEPGLKKAMETALQKYGPKEVGFVDRPSGQKPVVRLFTDDKKESEELVKNLADRTLVKLQDKFDFVKQPYVKGDDEAKKWNLLQAPTILIYDGSKENPEKNILARLGGKKSAREIKSALLKVLKKLEKK